MPGANNNSNPLPSSYLSGQHGALAAYETLLRSNYPIERWERPLGELAATAGPETVVIFAEPLTREASDLKAVRQIVEKGGRVLSTGFWAGSSCRARLAIRRTRSPLPLASLIRRGLIRWLRRRGVDGSAGEVATGQSGFSRRLQLCRAAGGCGVRLGQRACGVVGELDAARKRVAGARARS